MKKIIIVILLLLGVSANVYGAAFTSSQSGDFESGSTWGNGGSTAGVDYPDPAGGDTFLITIGHSVTISGNVTTSGQIAQSVGSDQYGARASLYVDTGAGLWLDGNMTVDEFSNLVMEEGSYLDLNGNNIDSSAQFWANWGRITYYFNGTVENPITVTSSPSGGNINCMSWNGSTVIGTYTTFQNVDWSFMAEIDLDYCTFDGGTAELTSGTTNTNRNVDIEYCNFINSNKPKFSHSNSYAPAEGVIRRVKNSYLSNGITFYGNTSQLEGCVVTGILSRASYGTNLSISGNMVYNATASSGTVVHFMNSGLSLEDNYFYCGFDNPHTLEQDGGGERIEIIGNIFEHTYTQAYTDSADTIIIKNGDYEIYDNILIESRDGVLVNTLTASITGTKDVHNNTVYKNVQGYGGLIRTEASGSYAGTVNLWNNLVYDTDSSSNGWMVNIVNAGDDQIDYTDYNAGYGDPSGQLYAFYSGVTMSTKTEGDPGFGESDFNLDPNFFDPTRALAAWDAANGGAGTAANAFQEMAKIGGYGGTFNEAYTVANLLDYVKAGFAPQTATFDTLGRDSDTVGAMPVATEEYPQGMTLHGLIIHTLGALKWDQ